jgi:hypothetical protein
LPWCPPEGSLISIILDISKAAVLWEADCTIVCSDIEFFVENGEEQCRYGCSKGIFPFFGPFCADLASKFTKSG